MERINATIVGYLPPLREDINWSATQTWIEEHQWASSAALPRLCIFVEWDEALDTHGLSKIHTRDLSSKIATLVERQLVSITEVNVWDI
jgi:hypothetical protein